MSARGKAGRQQATGAINRAECLQLRAEGLTYRQIARKMGVSSQLVHYHVAKELERLAEVAHESAEMVRAIELERLDMAVAALMPQVQTGHTPSVHALVRTIEKRAKLLGLDAPQEIHATNLTYADLIRMALEESGGSTNGEIKDTEDEGS